MHPAARRLPSPRRPWLPRFALLLGFTILGCAGHARAATLDLSPQGTLTVTTDRGSASRLRLSQRDGRYRLTDTGSPIALSAAARRGGFIRHHAHIVTGP